MKSILLIIPYFGKLPTGFQQFLLSCAYNPSVDFLLFTDDKTEYKYPPNFKVVYSSFEDITALVQGAFDFPVMLKQAYKLCDYKPAYGEIFKNYIIGYDFWGHCDIDLLFGDIRQFYSEEILGKYSKVGHLGHLSIYKNTPQINSYYRRSIVDETSNTIIEPYKIAYSTDKLVGFDEWMFDTGLYKVNELFMYYHESVYYENHYADLTPFTRPFIESYYDPYTKKRKYKRFFYYTWEKCKFHCVSTICTHF